LLASFVGDAAAHAAPFEETALTMERWWLREE
jgi:hypothetical protein